LLLSPAVAKGDIYVKKSKHTDAMTFMGQTEPAKDEEASTWISKDKFREDDGQTRTFIVRFDQNKMYFINHGDKSYSEIDLPIDLEKVLSAQAKQQMEMMQITAKVVDTGETLKIKDWNCHKYLIEISISMMGTSMPLKQEIWATKDVDIDLNLYQKFSSELVAANPMMKDMIEEMKKIKGFPIQTKFSMNMMGAEMKSQEEVISIEKKDAPAGTYNIPEGYTKSAYNPLQRR